MNFPSLCRLVRLVFTTGACFLSGVTTSKTAPAETDGQVAARETALELAGGFTNDGYKIRDGHWSGELKPGASQIVTVNLYAGNQYYFSLGVTDKAKKVAVIVYDETGKPVPEEQFFQDKLRAAAGVSPVASGPSTSASRSWMATPQIFACCTPINDGPSENCRGLTQWSLESRSSYPYGF